MNMKVQTLAILLLATACGGAYATTGVTTSGTEITVCVEAGETLAMPPIDASITKVVKTGGGEAQFTPAGVTNTFTAALEIQAGTLSGHRASFGKSSLITVVPGARLKLTGWDASAQWTQDTTSTIGAGKARIGGSGVGGAGALVRTFRYYPEGTLCLFTDLTLTDDTLMDTGGGLLGFLRGGTFDMGTHALTLTGSGRFDMTKGQVKNLGDIRSLSTQIYLEKNAVAYDANPAGKQIVLDGGSARADNAHDNWSPIPYGFHVKSDAVLDLTNGDGSHVNYDSFTGPVDVDSGKCIQLKTARKWGVPKNVTFSGKICSAGTLSLTGPGTFWITGRANSALGNIEMVNDARRVVCANLGHASVSNISLCGTTKSGEELCVSRKSRRPVGDRQLFNALVHDPPRFLLLLTTILPCHMSFRNISILMFSQWSSSSLWTTFATRSFPASISRARTSLCFLGTHPMRSPAAVSTRIASSS